MILVGILEQLELANILQEMHPKTGLLTIKHGEQRVNLYLKQGLIMCIDPHQGHTTLENGHAHSNGHTHIKDSFQNDLQEATRIIQDLLTWSEGEVYFEDEVQSPTDRSPLALHISFLVPSLLSLASTPILSTTDPKALVKAKEGLITPLPAVEEDNITEEDDITLKLPTPAMHFSNTTPVVEVKDDPVTPLPIVEEDDLPIELPTPVGYFSNTTPAVEVKDGLITPLPAVKEDDLPIELSTPAGYFSNTTPAVEAKNGPVTPLPVVEEDDLPIELPTPARYFSNTTPAVEVKDGPVTHFPTIADIPTLVQQPEMPLDTADTILPDAITTLIPIFKPGQRRFAGLRWEVLIIVAVLLVAALAHGINMFHFPYYEDDEGTYVSQASAVVHLGQLAYYTYWYDHAPAGWLQIAIWGLVTGGFHTFGSAINSGRFLMLLMQLGSAFILYRIARNISNSVTVAVIATLIFALSPYGLYFHRRVLLDNITTFWMLLSILFLLSDRQSLNRVWLSALALSLSVLSKEVTVFLVPVLMYLVFFRANKSHRWFATIGWIALVSCLLSLYPLMATLKGELFPTGTLLGGTAPHVSLLGTLQFQASRGKDGGLLDLQSGFWRQTRIWIQDDPMLVVVGSVCAILSLLTMKKQRLVGVIGAATLSLWVFLARGGEIIGFYLVPLLPLLALNVGLVLGLAFKGLKILLRGSAGIAVTRIIQVITIGMCLFGTLVGYTTSPDLGFQNNSFLLWDTTQTDAQNQAIQWVERNIPLNSRLVIDEYMWQDLYDNGYRFAHYYWKVEEDPAIRDKVFHNDWRNIDYIITTQQLLSDAQHTQMDLIEAALSHSTLIAHFDSGGWPIEIRKVHK